MLMLSNLYLSKDIWSDGCGSAGFDASNEWSFGVTDNEWSVKVPDIYLRSFVSTLDFP